ncbi:acyl-[acyl-carrier-protein] thioesterase [Rhodocaloribacter sp.]
MPETITPWTETFRVRSYEVEPSGRASVETLCHYLETAASAHAQVLGFSIEHLVAHNLTWVLTRLHLRVEAFPHWRDEVRLTTWPSGQNGLFATREFLLHDAAGNLLARATSGWVTIDLARRRPVRLPAFFRDLTFPDRPRALDDAFPRLRPPAVDAFERRFRVRYGDLDLNGHVNNVQYVAWAVETMPPAFIEAHRLADLQIHLRAETHYDDRVLARAGPESAETGVFWHRLTREADGREVAVARTQWVAEG